MMKFSKKTKNFILYGIDNKIEKKQIYKLDGVMLFFLFLAMFIAELTSAPLLTEFF